MTKIDNLVAKIALPGTENYGCYRLLKELLQNEDFYNVVCQGVEEGKITGFSQKLWNNFAKQNIRMPGNLIDYFAKGNNIGRCKVYATIVSYSFMSCNICGGVVPILKGSANSDDGSHTWIDIGTKIIDTSLMLEINNSYKNIIGYQEENRYNPNFDTYYCASKEFAFDSHLRGKYNGI